MCNVLVLGWLFLVVGMMMGFLMLVCVLFYCYMEGLLGVFLIESLGYLFGFLVVILVC